MYLNKVQRSKITNIFSLSYTIYGLVTLKKQPLREQESDKKMVVIATGIHLYPYRTEKLSPLAPMVLLYQVGE